MKMYVSIDDDHFVVFETKTGGVSCPNCGQVSVRETGSTISFYEGRRDEEDGWVFLAQRPLTRLPTIDDFERVAREFAQSFL